MVRNADTQAGDGRQQRAILERAVSGREFVALMKSADPNRLTVKKKVQCFLHNNAYFELQTFVQPDVGLSILKSEMDTSDIEFPWFVQVKGDVTGVAEFSSFWLAEHYNKVDTRHLNWKTNQVMAAAFERAKSRPKKTEE